jgi:hypothetical protein
MVPAQWWYHHVSQTSIKKEKEGETTRKGSSYKFRRGRDRYGGYIGLIGFRFKALVRELSKFKT